MDSLTLLVLWTFMSTSFIREKFIIFFHPLHVRREDILILDQYHVYYLFENTKKVLIRNIFLDASNKLSIDCRYIYFSHRVLWIRWFLVKTSPPSETYSNLSWFNGQQHRLTKGYNEWRKEIVFLRWISLNATYSSEQYLLVTINLGKRLSWLPQNIIISFNRRGDSTN